MNKHDRDNYLFIMSLTPQQFEEWYATISDDDAEYALELIRTARLELIEQSHTLIDEVDDLSDAQLVLAKFMLNGGSK